MRLACIVLAHRGPEQLARLLAELRHDCVRTYLHLDLRSRQAPFSRALEKRGLGETVSLRRRRSVWGGAKILDAALEGLGRGLSDGCDYFLLLSGQDFPLWPIEEIVSFFEEAGERSFVEHFPLPASHWRLGGRDRTDYYTVSLMGRRLTCVPRGVDVPMSWKGRALNGLLGIWTAFRPPRRFPSCAKAFGGSQWWNLSAPAARYALRFLEEHPGYREYHDDTLLPDELFFQSILLGTPFCDNHEIINDALRFMIWPPQSTHPITLDTGDLPAMIGSGKPFARKFDAVTAPEVLAQLPVRGARGRTATYVPKGANPRARIG